MDVAAFDSDTRALIKIDISAVEKARSLMREEGDINLKLRIFVTGGGCSGFQYGFAFDTKTAADDIQLHQDGITVVIDALSFPYLMGAHLRYSEGLEGSRFIIDNPNATSTCSCGASFTL